MILFFSCFQFIGFSLKIIYTQFNVCCTKFIFWSKIINVRITVEVYKSVEYKQRYDAKIFYN